MPEETLNGIVEGLIENQPVVREEIVTALQESKTNETSISDPTPIPTPQATPTDFVSSHQTDARASGEGLASSTGETFDPSIHESEADGTPRRTLDGKLRRKRGRKAGGTNALRPPSTTIVTPTVNPANYAAMGAFFSGLFFQGCTSVFGPSWEPKPEEKTSIEGATTNYCASKGMVDLPPGIMLVMVVSLYVLPRLNDEETHRRIRGVGEKFGLVASKPKAVPKPEAKPTPTPNDNGHVNPVITGIPIPDKKINPLSQFTKDARIEY